MQLPIGYWIASKSNRVNRRPLAVTVHGVPMVLFRNKEGRVVSLLDRCAHRNVALSAGKVVENNIECPYHGWQFNERGVCKHIPGMKEGEDVPGFQVPSFFVKEEHGYVWVAFTQEDTEEKPKLDFPPSYQKLAYEFEIEGSLDQVLENQLDVIHTSILHGGWFRNASRRQTVMAHVIERKNSMEVEYVGEKRPEGLVARVISPRSGEVRHIDRLFLPATTQVEYQLGGTHFIATTFLTPTVAGKISCYAIVHFKTWLPAFLVKPAVWLSTGTILKQDVDLLKSQSENIRRFSQLHFVSTKLDLYTSFIRQKITNPRDDDNAEKRYDLTLTV